MTMRIRIKSSSDLGAGALLAGCAAAFLYLGTELERGTAFQMGPGFFPTAIGSLLVGGALIVKSLRAEGPSIEPVRLAPVLFVLAGILAFTSSIDRLGLILAGTITMLLASFASRQDSWLRAVIVSVAVSVFSSLLFVVALGLSIRLWPAI
jgi:Tripartite tricarboxylate transporter TctB family